VSTCCGSGATASVCWARSRQIGQPCFSFFWIRVSASAIGKWYTAESASVAKLKA
jgi:hypothetical protein